jgi:hypothetical protein
VIAVLNNVLQPLAILVLGSGALAYVLAPVVQHWLRHRAGDD